MTNDKVEEYLIDMELPFEQVQEGMWLIHDDHEYVDNLVVIHTPPVITFRVKIMDLNDVDESIRSSLFQRLLEYNAQDMVSGAYGLEDDAVVIIDSLQSENLDYNEFQASIDSITLSIRQHYTQIREFVPATESPEDAEGDGEMSVAELEESIMEGRG
jgi:hypothetical protein